MSGMFENASVFIGSLDTWNVTNVTDMSQMFSNALAFNQPLFNHENQLITGFGLDYSDIKFNQSKQYGLVNADRSIAGYTDYDPDMEVKLKGTTKTYSLFATDNFSINKQLNLTLSGRYNNTNIDNKDLLDPHDDPAESLTARHTYQRLNPAIGLAYSPVNNLTVYGSYNEGTRAPTSMELGCANPGKPCKLPNAMAGDPPLNQVITETFDGGLRGKLLNDNINYSLSGYRSINNNDIQFVSNGAAAGLGYFKNIDKTQRLGIDAVLSGKNFKLLNDLINYCRKEKVIIYASFVLSILYNFIGIFFAVQGDLMPVIAAILMPISSISIVLLTTGLSSYYELKLKKIII
jgi:outer membrane receptor protein involved in Fe transport